MAWPLVVTDWACRGKIHTCTDRCVVLWMVGLRVGVGEGWLVRGVGGGGQRWAGEEGCFWVVTIALSPASSSALAWERFVALGLK